MAFRGKEGGKHTAWQEVCWTHTPKDVLNICKGNSWRLQKCERPSAFLWLLFLPQVKQASWSHRCTFRWQCLSQLGGARRLARVRPVLYVSHRTEPSRIAIVALL